MELDLAPSSFQLWLYHCRVLPTSTDGRSFVEVAKHLMDKRLYQGRDGRDGDRPWKNWELRESFQH
jgi:hypothetical protein